MGWAAGAAAVACLAAVAVARQPAAGRVQTPPPQPAHGRVAAAVSARGLAGAAAILSPEAQVRFAVVYASCGVRREGTGPVPVGLIGQTRAGVALALAPAVVVGFSADLLVVERRLPGCPGDTVTLVERDGLVVELSGPPGDTGAVLRRTGIPVRGLGQADAARIEAGLAVPARQAAGELARLAREAGADAAGFSTTPGA